MSEESIINELVAENTLLRSEAKTFKESNKEILTPIEINSLSDVVVTEELANKLKISGILLAEGLWNGVLYTKSELKKMYDKFKETLSNLDIKVEHDKSEEFKDKIVGKNTNCEWSDSLGALIYNAEVTNPKAIELIKNGTFPSTSMKTQLKKITSNGLTKGVDYEPIDNSLTQRPACSVCNIISKEELSLAAKDSKSIYKFYGIIKERDINSNEVKNIKEVNEVMSNPKQEIFNENIELSQEMVSVLPETEETPEEDVELELMTLSEALKRKRVIYEYYPPGTYPKAKKLAKRKKGYYYPEYQYPYYPYYGKPVHSPVRIPITSLSIIELEDELETIEENSEFKIIKNKRSGKFIVFKNTGKTGFGAWKIVKQFDSEKEAKDFTGGKNMEEKQQEQKDENGCIIGKEEWDDKQQKCISVSLEEQSAWTDCMGQEMKSGKSFMEAVKACKLIVKKATEEKAKVKCPVCDKEFPDKEKMIEHFNKEHGDKYGDYGKYKEQKTMSEELRRKKCEFCDELFEDLDKHYIECKIHKETVENVVKCKFCGKEFKNKKELISHLPECKKYGKYKKEGAYPELSSPPEEKKIEPTPAPESIPIQAPVSSPAKAPESTPVQVPVSTSEIPIQPQVVPEVKVEPKPATVPEKVAIVTEEEALKYLKDNPDKIADLLLIIKKKK